MSLSNQHRYCAMIEYDGGDFAGFQRQNPPTRTVQGEIERALRHIGHHPVTVNAAGRTDAGVHATGQVIAFQLSWRHDLPTLRKAINVNLPHDIAVRQIALAPEGFHPRFDARRREYTYFVECLENGVKQPLTYRYRWQLTQKLDLALMNQAAALLIGEHDFATFGTPPQGVNTVRKVFKAAWVKRDNTLEFTIEANAFLFRMVRTIVGTLVRVGDRRWSLKRFQNAFEAHDRGLAASPAPPNGLVLSKVTYDMMSNESETESELIR